MAETMNDQADEPTGDQDAPREDEHQDQAEPTGDQGAEDTRPDEHDQDQADELKRERAAREAAEKEAARLRRANAAVKGVDLDALRDEVRAEFTQQLVRAEVRAAAAGRLRDPADALALVDTAGLVGEGGDVDAAAVTRAVDELLKAKPYLADSSPNSPAPWGDVGAGPRSSATPEPATPLDRLRRAFGPN